MFDFTRSMLISLAVGVLLVGGASLSATPAGAAGQKAGGGQPKLTCANCAGAQCSALNCLEKGASLMHAPCNKFDPSCSGEGGYTDPGEDWGDPGGGGNPGGKGGNQCPGGKGCEKDGEDDQDQAKPRDVLGECNEIGNGFPGSTSGCYSRSNFDEMCDNKQGSQHTADHGNLVCQLGGWFVLCVPFTDDSGRAHPNVQVCNDHEGMHSDNRAIDPFAARSPRDSGVSRPGGLEKPGRVYGASRADRDLHTDRAGIRERLERNAGRRRAAREQPSQGRRGLVVPAPGKGSAAELD